MKEVNVVMEKLFTSAKEALSEPVTQQELDNLSQVQSNTYKDIVVLDVDEVIVNITPKWVYKIYQHKEDFTEFFDLSQPYDPSKEQDALRVLYRNNYYLDHWLLKDEIDPATIHRPTYEKVVEKMIDLYNVDNFYDDLKPTPLVNGLLSALSKKKQILSKIIIISKVAGEHSEASKTRFLKETFSSYMDKVDIYYVDKKEKKSDVLKALPKDEKERIAAVYEDYNNNIVDLLTNGDLRTVQIFSPSFRYNLPNTKYLNLLKEYDCQLHRYSY